MLLLLLTVMLSSCASNIDGKSFPRSGYGLQRFANRIIPHGTSIPDAKSALIENGFSIEEPTIDGKPKDRWAFGSNAFIGKTGQLTTFRYRGWMIVVTHDGTKVINTKTYYTSYYPLDL